MATNVIMPALGMDQETGTLVRWIKREGEAVARGEPIMEIETDKVTVEIEANASGVLANVTAQEGDEIPVGQVIAQILDSEEVEQGLAASGSSVAPFPAHLSQAPSARPQSPREEDAQAPPRQASHWDRKEHAGRTRVLASPLARRLAQERGVNLVELRGSGPEGAVLAADVWAAPAGESVSIPTSSQVELSQPPTPDAEAVSVSRAWSLMAQRMTESWTTAPHFVLMREVDASALIEMRARITPAVEQRAGTHPTYTDLLVKMSATALRSHPRLNSSWAGGEIRLRSEVNVGIAVATEEALLVPVVHGADRLGIGEIAARRRELVDRATSGRLAPSDLEGGTFTISNLGMYGVDAFNAILNPPQAAILAVGRIAERVAARNGQPVVCPTIILTLSSDHRVVDGARAAQFLEALARLIEEPWALLA